MTAVPNEEFSRIVMGMANTVMSSDPVVSYDPDGDCIEFFASPEPFYAERVDELVTIYHSQETKEIVGSQIKGVKAILKKFPGLLIDVQDGKIRLQHLFRARIWSDQIDLKDVKIIAYQKLIEVAERTEAEAELSLT